MRKFSFFFLLLLTTTLNLSVNAMQKDEENISNGTCAKREYSSREEEFYKAKKYLEEGITLGDVSTQLKLKKMSKEEILRKDTLLEKKTRKLKLPTLPKNTLHSILMYVDSPTIKKMSHLHSSFNKFYKIVRGVNLTVNGAKADLFLSLAKHRIHPFPKVNSLTLTGDWTGGWEKGSFHRLFGFLNTFSHLCLEETSLSLDDATVLAVLLPRNLVGLSLRIAPTKDCQSGRERTVHSELLKYSPSTLKMCALRDSSSPHRPILKNMPHQLEELHIISLSSSGMFWSPPKGLVFSKLKTLKFVDGDFTFSSKFTEILGFFPSLIRLSLENSASFIHGKNDLISLFKALPASIEFFEITHSVPISISSFEKELTLDLSHLPRLKELHLRGIGLKKKSTKIISDARVVISPSGHPLIVKGIKGEEIPPEALTTLNHKELKYLSGYVDSRKALSSWSGEAIYQLASIFLKQLDGEKDSETYSSLERVARLYERAQEKGMKIDQKGLGSLFFRISQAHKSRAIDYESKGFLHTHDEQQRITCLGKAVKYNHEPAGDELASLYIDGEIKEEDVETLYQIARLYRDKKIAIDPSSKETHEDKALGLFLPLAKKGNPYAQHNVGNLYNKLGEFKDAAKWYKKAAAQGLKESEMNLKKLPIELKKK
ncbi:MAG: hypothetical protein JSR85_08450 [Proteobacteria bacterium]|nr:hypothetical protein [Pseudomonadota bacterium]